VKLASYEIFVTFVPLIYEDSQLSQDYFFTTGNTEKTEVIKTQITKKCFLFNGNHGMMFQKIYYIIRFRFFVQFQKLVFEIRISVISVFSVVKSL